jgi:type IV pilus assembly protein PilY1
MAHAEDIDLFVNSPASSQLPNVLFIVDNTANWTQAFPNEKSALQNTFNNLPVNSDGSAKFNVGVMFFTETGNSNNNTRGGYVCMHR